jgi:GTP 3',8-cyclase
MSGMTLFQKIKARPLLANVPTPQSRVSLLRLSVTEGCNFHCRYCMPENAANVRRKGTPLRMTELADHSLWLVRLLGVQRVKLTGGEPLTRSGVQHFIELLAQEPTVHEISMTTNGSLLAGKARQLKDCGLARVNVSLDSLNPRRFRELSRGGELAATLAGIDTALLVGLNPLKLNAVLQRTNWQQEVSLLLDFAAQRQLELRFIELMRTGTERTWCESELLPVEEVRTWLATRTELSDAESEPQALARKEFVLWKGVRLTIGWIAPRTHPFCSRCVRLRMDPHGRVRRCLMDAEYLDLASFRKTLGDEAAAEAFAHYFARKRIPSAMDMESTMSLIGG